MNETNRVSDSTRELADATRQMAAESRQNRQESVAWRTEMAAWRSEVHSTGLTVAYAMGGAAQWFGVGVIGGMVLILWLKKIGWVKS